MAKIVYSMCGEGRGHATRVQTVIETLSRHRFILLAARDAYETLYERYEGHPRVSVRRLPGLFFSYKNNRVDYVRSVLAAVPYLWKLSGVVEYVTQMILREKPDLAITDFEPILPRAARKCNLPCISMDHQHFLSSSDFASMPFRFRWRGWFLRGSIPLFYPKQNGEAVSSFFHLPPRTGTENIKRFGVLLRPSVLEAAHSAPASQGHLLVYIRRHAPDKLWSILENSGRSAIVYGLGARPDMCQGKIQFREIADQQFVHDLATSECLISTAGNQLIGEAFYLNKPVLAIPEPGNFEQQLNGWLVSKSGGGWSVTFEQLSTHLLQQFLVASPLMRATLRKLPVCGNTQAKEFIEKYLPAPQVHDLQTDQPTEVDLAAIAKLLAVNEE
jgi:uncharacterized protein (TIGR00661 family)